MLLGESGSGKSDLALRLIDRGAQLVSDDQVRLYRRDNAAFASSPDTIKGLLELRGIGIIKLPYKEDMPLSLVVRLTGRQDIERLPEQEFYDCLGIRIPLIRLYPFDISSPIKIEMMLSEVAQEN